LSDTVSSVNFVTFVGHTKAERFSESVFCMLTVSQSQNVGKCRAAGLSKLKSKCQSENKQKDISAYFRNSFAFHKRYLSSILSYVYAVNISLAECSCLVLSFIIYHWFVCYILTLLLAETTHFNYLQVVFYYHCVHVIT